MQNKFRSYFCSRGGDHTFGIDFVELKKLHQIASQLGLGLDNHLAEGYVVSPRAAFSRVWEKSSIPQHSICPRDTIFSTPLSNVIFLLEGVHPYEDEALRAAAGGHRRWWCRIDVLRWLWRGRRAAPRGGMVDGVVRERPREGRRLQMMSGGGGGRRSR